MNHTGKVLDHEKYVASILDEEICAAQLLEKGQIGPVYRISTQRGTYLLKISEPSDRLHTEAKMLEDINKYKIRVPKIYHVSPTHLLMEYIEESSVPEHIRETEAANLLAQLHTVTNENRMYGYYYDTTIGPFRQHNEQTQYHWTLFLGQMRILPMAKICYDKGYIDKKMLSRLESLCRDMYRRIDMGKITPSLLHGDLWGGNILFNMKETVLIDPAIYFGDREMDLAFILLFDTFGDTFLHTYMQSHPLSEDFYEVKVPLYQVYPYLVHLALYGTLYLKGLHHCLDRLSV